MQPVWLAAFTTDELHGRLAPDGRRLVYAGNQKGNLDIWVKDLTSGIPQRLTSHVATDTQPAWSPDGKRVVFVSMRKDVKGDLYLWSDGKLTELTDRTTADTYPVFAPDGKSVYWAAGPQGLSRVERLDLASGTRTPLTDWDSTHPAISPDGRLLAYTQFDRNRRGRIALLRLGQGRPQLITAAAYHAGFPAFAPDGRRLLFSRFVSGSPDQPLSDKNNSASLWSVDVGRALAAADPARLEPALRPLTSGRQTALLVQVTGQGLVFTTVRAGSLDIGLLPPNGPFPRLSSPAKQLELALAQDDVRDRLLGLELVSLMGRGVAASRALYLRATLHRELGEFSQARVLLERLRDESPRIHGDVAYLARNDLPLLEVEQAVARRGKVDPATLRHAERRLQAVRLPDDASQRVEAHRLLREGDLQRMGGELQAAIESYETQVQRYPLVRDHAAEAQFWLGQLFARVRTPDLLATYYLSLFRRYPEQVDWLRRSAQAVLDLYQSLPPAEQVERLRALSDLHRRQVSSPPTHASGLLFCAVAEMRMARLHEQLGQLGLAISAMARVTRDYPGPQLVKERTKAAFELGRISLRNYDRLRQRGKLSEALSFYDKALAAYAQVIKTFEPGHENHTRARVEFLRLSLLMAAQLERDKELVPAQKRYQAILALEPDNLQAHRKLIQFGLQQGRGGALKERYRARILRDPGDFVGHYALGYLATFSGGEHLSAAALDDAEEHLKRAVSLNPQSPFGHMTLGWVYEMRERYLGQEARGWLEQAILLYDRAYGLNDARIDVQTEADLLLNQANAFANLGNGWKQAYELCERREQLKIPFLSREREAMFHMTFGRAASATGRYRVSNEQLERVLDLARDLGRPALEAEAVARLALTAQLQGDHDRAVRNFRQALELCRKLGRGNALASLTRSVAFNLARQGQRRAALEQLAVALQELQRNATAPIDAYKPIEGANCGKLNCSTAPYGFDRIDESYIARAIQQQILQQQGALPEVARLIQQRMDTREPAKKLREKEKRGPQEELDLEPLLLRNDLALTRLALGDEDASHRQMKRALDAVEQMQQGEKKVFNPDPALFPVQTALQLNWAEHVLRRLAPGQPALDRAVAALQQLQQTADRAEALQSQGKPLLPERVRLALWSDLALLSAHVGLRRPMSPSPPVKGVGPAERAMNNVWRRAAPLVQAVQLLRRLMVETSPDRISEESDASRALAVATAERMGVLEPLWRPLSNRERLRWHLLAGLNLAQVAGAFTPPRRLAAHPTTDMLQQLVSLHLTRELGALRFALLAELAHRRGDMVAMDAAVNGFLQRSPLLLERADLEQAEQIRALIFGRAVDLALIQNDIHRALAWAEQRERRAFVDELLLLPPRGHGRVARPLAALFHAAEQYQAHLAREPAGPGADLDASASMPASAPASAPALTPARPSEPAPPSREQQVWRGRLDRLEQDVARALQTVRRTAPAVGELLSAVPDFPEKPLLETLVPGQDVAVTALEHRGQAVLIALSPTAEPRVARVPLRQGNLSGVLQRLSRGASRVYVDLGRIDPGLEPHRLLPRVRTVRLATLWELVDAYHVRNLAFTDGLVVDSDVAAARRLAGALGLKALGGDGLALDRMERRLEQAGVLIWNGPKRFDGGPAVGLRLLLHDPKQTRLQDLLPGRELGLPLRGQLLVLPDLKYTPGRERPERIALLRLAHAMGLPAVLTLPRSAMQPAALKQVLSGLKRLDLTEAVLPLGPVATLHGFAGMSPKQAEAFARKMLDLSARAGVAAFGKRQLVQAVEQLEATRRYMDYLQDFKYQSGALEYLAQSYTLLEDYARAIPLMKQLLTLRAAAVEEARTKAPKTVLAAQAKWVKTLTDMAWLRMRNKQYDEALNANDKAIQLYIEVKRPLLAQSSYVQRAIIAEKKGDNPLALGQAQLALVTARKALASSSGNAGARAAVADAAERVARFQRTLFSNYRAAAAAAGVALEHIPEVQAQQLDAINARTKGLTQVRQGIKQEDKARLAALDTQLKQLQARRSSLIKDIARRVQVILELARIQGARGDFNRAARRAEEAWQLCRAAGADQLGPQREAALLELVNNLYYTGAFGLALARASDGLASTQQPLRKIQFHNARGTVFASLGQTARALEELRSALFIATKLSNVTEIAASRNNLGNALRLAGRFEEARREFRVALEVDQRQEDRLGMAFDHANLGLTLELMQRYQDARHELNQALTLSRKIGAPLNELKALAGLGRFQITEKAYDGALSLFRQGLALANRLGLSSWAWRFRLLQARVLKRQNHIARARTTLQVALAMVEHGPPRLRKALGSPQVEQQPEDLYDELIDLLARQGDAVAAFDLAERLRARTFVDLVSQDSQRLVVGVEAVKQVTALQRELEAARSAELRAHSTRSAELKEATAEVQRVQKELDAARTTLNAANPGLSPLVVVDPWPLSRLQPLLPKKALLLSYVPTRDRLVIFALRGGKLSLKVVPVSRRQLVQTIGQYRQDLIQFNPVDRLTHQLYQWLLEPVLGRESDPPERLVIIPGGPVHLVPFAALHPPGQPPLVQRHAVSYLSSANALRRLNLGRGAGLSSGPSGGKAGASKNLRRVSFGWTGRAPRPLTFTVRETEAFASAFEQTVTLQGPQATRARLLKEAVTADVLHIASHADFRPEAPLSTSIELADGELPLLELLGLKLRPGALVILSACDTGTGHLDGADAMVGLDQAFIAAGARRVVSSLWRVSDLGAALTMKHLFRGLARHGSPARALQQAQNRLRQRFPHPAFWAAFRVDGAP